jgi:hypothetical protein
MKKQLLSFASIAMAATFSIAAEGHSAQEDKEDAARHRAMATAHSAAAQCLGSKSPPETCLATLKASCSGLAVGKFCGLKQDAWANAAKSLTLTAQAHQAAAACIELGKPTESCLWDLQSACKGLAIGKYCGMVHAH